MKYKKKKTKKTPRDKCWDAFSLVIRLEAANEYGQIQCCTCPHVGPWKTFDAGHFMSRRHENTFLHRVNVNAQCRGCNRMKEGKQYEHGLYIDKTYGKGWAEKLYAMSRMTKRRTDVEYLELRKYYMEEARKIASAKGIKL